MDPRKLLIVCDDWARLEWYEDHLRPRFAEVHSEFLWKEALKTAERERPDLALVDLLMEDCHGLELARKFEEHSEITRAIPLTLVVEKDELAGLRPGEESRWRIVTRPFDRDALVAGL